MTEIFFECSTCKDNRIATSMRDFGTMFEYRCGTCHKYTQIGKVYKNDD